VIAQADSVSPIVAFSAIMKSPAVAALQAHDEFRPQLTNWRGDRGRDRRRMLGRTTKHPRYDRGQGSKRSGDDDHVQIGGSEPGAVRSWPI